MDELLSLVPVPGWREMVRIRPDPRGGTLVAKIWAAPAVFADRSPESSRAIDRRFEQAFAAFRSPGPAEG